MLETDLASRPSARRDDADASGPAARPVEAELRSVVSPSLAPRLPRGADTSAAKIDLQIDLPIELQVHTDLSAVEAEWTRFEQRADCTPFQLFDWLAKWQRHIGALTHTVPAIVFGRDGGGELAFILPLAIETRGVVRRLTWLGSRLCDYNAPLLAENFSRRIDAENFAALWRRVIGLLQADRRTRFDLIDLPKMPHTIGSQKNPLLTLETHANPSGAYVASLAGDWDRFYAARRSAATRKRERRQLKQLAEHGAVACVDVRDDADVGRTLDALIDQKSRSFARMGVENMFARPGYRAFYRDVATNAHSHVSRLDVGATVAAANLGLRFRDCYYLILSSYHDGELSRCGPGRAHLHELIRHAIEGGLRRFDFTIGDEPYKRDWSDIEVKLVDHLAAATLRGWLALAGTVAYRRTKRLIKQTPMLWHAFSKVRARVATKAARPHSSHSSCPAKAGHPVSAGDD